MSQLFVDNITSKSGGAIGAPSGVVVTGVVTATSFSGDGSGLSGIDATALKDSGGNVKLQGNTSGIVVTGVSTFSGNVSVGGVLTYDDVTNVDSVGLITARSGIKIGAGQSVSAVSGIATYYGDGSQLSGIELGTQSFVASGAIANGQTVIIKTDGTVGIVTQTDSPASAGSPATFETQTCNWISATFDSNTNKVVIAYEDNGNSNYGTAIVGTVSGTSISFGSPVVYASVDSNYNSIVFDSNSNKVVIAYYDSTNTRGRGIVGTVSGTSISFGSPTNFISNNANPIRMTYTESGKVVIVYRDGSNSYHGYAIVGTVSGTSISFGSQTRFNDSNTSDLDVTWDSNAVKAVVVYEDNGNNNYPTAIIGSISGTSISFGSEVVIANTDCYDIHGEFDSTNNKIVVAYADQGDGNSGKSAVGTVSGTSISFGTPVEFDSDVNYISMAYNSTTQRMHINYADNDNSGSGTAIDGAVSGTTISFGTPVVFKSGQIYYGEEGSTFDSNAGKVVHAYRAAATGEAVVITSTSQTTNLTTENYIGIAAEAISNTATGKITVVGGINTGQTGLTTAQTYFVQNNGTLGTSAGSPSVVAGTSISYTKIVVR